MITKNHKMFTNISKRILNISLAIVLLQNKIDRLNKHLEQNPTDQIAMLSVSMAMSNKHKLESISRILTIRSLAREFCIESDKIIDTELGGES